MDTEMRENIKVGLLGAISLLLLMQVLMQSKGAEDETVVTSGANFTSQSTPPPAANAAQPNLLAQEQTIELPDNTPATTMEFAEIEYDFGTVKQNTTDNFHIFKFKNTGNEPLIITNAKGSCGCTVPKFPTEPILPGDEGEIEVSYSPGTQKGSQTKTVTITANTNPSQTRVTIKAMVEEVGI